MAHELNINSTTGRASMFYYGDVPWHGLGTRLDKPATWAEAEEAAGLGWTVSEEPLETLYSYMPVPGKKAIIRDDTKTVLGVVGSEYKPVQNREAFAFLDGLAGDGQIEYHTAGALGDGEKTWMLAKLPGVARIGRSNDTVEKYLLLSNAHDGSQALRVLWTPVRVVCANTLSLATAKNRNGVWISHTGDLDSKIEQARNILGMASKFYDDLEVLMGRLAAHRPTEGQLDAYFRNLYPDPETEIDRERRLFEEQMKAASRGWGAVRGTDDGPRGNNNFKVRDELFRLVEEGIGNDDPAIKGSSWAALNAVTEFVDHKRPRSMGKTAQAGQSNALSNIWFGNGAAVKAKAWSGALDMAGV